MNELDKNLTPEDIPELTKGGDPNIWRPFIEKFGPEPMQWLMDQVWESIKQYPAKTYIPDPHTIRRNTRDRLFQVERPS